MKTVIDACVLVPTLTRALVLEVARAGLIAPVWSPGILEEWRHAAARSGEIEAAAVEAEIALMRARWPGAEVTPDPALIAAQTLPDPDDRHVLAAAVAAQADQLLTFNSKDFPLRVLAAQGVLRRHPDTFLIEALAECDTAFRAQVEQACRTMARSPRAVLKAAQLPRLGKALFG